MVEKRKGGGGGGGADLEAGGSGGGGSCCGGGGGGGVGNMSFAEKVASPCGGVATAAVLRRADDEYAWGSDPASVVGDESELRPLGAGDCGGDCSVMLPAGSGSAGGGGGGGGLLDDDRVSGRRIFCMTMFNFPYGCICTTMGMFILPAEAVRLFPDNEAFALGCFLLLVGVSQLICPYVGLVSDRCTWQLGRRRPYIIGGSLSALACVWVMRYTSLRYMPWAFGGALFAAMTSMNVIYSAQCSLVPDLVPDARQGAASGMVAVQQLLGSFTGFALVLAFRSADIHLAYLFYQVLLTSVVAVVCLASHETPLDPSRAAPPPTWRETARGYTIDTTRDLDFFWVFVSRTFFYAAVSCQAFMLYYIRDVAGEADPGRQRQEMALVAIIGQLTAACVAFPVGRISDHRAVSRKSLIYLACGVMSIVYGVFILTPLLVSDGGTLMGVVYCAAAFYGLGNGCYLAVDYALALDVLPSKATAGQDLGVWGIAAFIGSSAGPVLWGTLLKMCGREDGSDRYSVIICVFFL